LLIELTAATRVLLDAGTRVNVSKETAGIIIGLGRAVEVREAEKQASKEPKTAPQEDLPEEGKKSKKRGTKKE
jgi:hypothetical protein